MRDRLVELRIDAFDQGERHAIAFYFVPGHAEGVAETLRAVAASLDAIFTEVRPL
jgi:hypothetical protein